ncbi:MAG: hypothetical protein WCN95_13595, partial [bacterium]
LGFCAVSWILAWTRFSWFTPLQHFTFSPPWFAYIVVVNALTYRRTGHCMLKDRPRYFFALFAASAAFWWFFEYLNRFVQNWYYEGVAGLSSIEYFVFATLPFSTVLPAVLGTYEWLESIPGAGAGLDNFFRINIRRTKAAAWILLAGACIGLAGVGVWPDLFFPLLWLAPLFIMTSLQAIRGENTIFAPIRLGCWRKLYLLAMAALICGFFWEMWNVSSLAKWKYSVPFVGEFKIFEMPILGFAGYLPFGLECAVIGELVNRLITRHTDQRESDTARSSRRGIFASIIALIIAAGIWLPCLHLLFKQDVSAFFADRGIPPKAKAIAARQIKLWSNPELRAVEIGKMRGSNAEWDFMARTYFVLSLANMAIRDPSGKADYLKIMDCIIEETISLEKKNGIYYFLMDYARAGRFISTNKRSLFQDGEIALMVASRRMVEEKSEYVPILRERVEFLLKSMQESPVLTGESYPDECWIFCNAIALDVIRMADVLDGTDHAAFLDKWMATAKLKLIDDSTGLLISSCSFDGTIDNGPEGSSIWMIAHCLQIIDHNFAKDQYRHAKAALARNVLGFGYAVEWPRAWKGQKVPDVDSGPIIPILDISAGSSGMAFLGAASFSDREYLSALLTSLTMGGLPVERNGHLRYCASNQVGDAVLLYSMVQGPLWRDVNARYAAMNGTQKEKR